MRYAKILHQFCIVSSTVRLAVYKKIYKHKDAVTFPAVPSGAGNDDFVLHHLECGVYHDVESLSFT